MKLRISKNSKEFLRYKVRVPEKKVKISEKRKKRI